MGTNDLSRWDIASIEHIGLSVRVIWREDGRKQYERFTDDELGQAAAEAYRTAVEAYGNRRPPEAAADPGRPRRPWPGQSCTLDRWWAYWISGVTGISDYSLKTNMRICRQHIAPTFGGMEIASIDRTRVGQWANDMALLVKPQTVRNRLAVLTAVLGGAMAPPNALIVANPAAKIKVGESIQEEMRFLTRDNLARLMAACPRYYRPLLILAVATGLRWGELGGLRRKDVTPQERKTYITVRQSLKKTYENEYYFGPPKTRAARRRISVPEYAVETIAPLLEGDPEGLVFTARRGSHLVGPNFRKGVWVPALKKGLIIDAFTMATTRIDLTANAIFHSARGAQYLSDAYQRTLADHSPERGGQVRDEVDTGSQAPTSPRTADGTPTRPAIGAGQRPSAAGRLLDWLRPPRQPTAAMSSPIKLRPGNYYTAQ